MAKARRRGGRPPKGEYAGKSAVMNFRVRPDTKQLLEAAAHASERTLSQETEHQLRRALFHTGVSPIHALMATIASVIDGLRNLENPKARWFSDPYLFAQGREAMTTAYEMFCPEGAPPQTIEENLELGGRMQGRLAILERLRDIQIADPSVPLSKRSQHERILVMEKTDLGALAERPRVYGMTADQTREEHKLGVRLGELMRKARKPEAMTPSERKRLDELADQIAELQKRARVFHGRQRRQQSSNEKGKS